MNIKIGNAPNSWGIWFPDDVKQTPWQRFLDEVSEAGYNWIELGPYGYLPTDLHRLRTELAERGLKVCGTYVMGSLETPSEWPELERQVRKIGELLGALGAKYLVLIDDLYNDLFTGKLKTPSILDENEWKRLIDTTHRVADLVLTHFGLTVVFHPHAATHVEYDHQIQMLLEQTDPGLVSLCFDTGHHAYRGGDPVSFMRQHYRRIPYLHLKNVDTTMQKKFGAENMALAAAVEKGMFCEPSQGLMDYGAFRDVLLEIDYDGFAIVEQDMYPAAFDKPLPIAKRTRAYLKEIGIG